MNDSTRPGDARPAEGQALLPGRTGGGASRTASGVTILIVDDQPLVLGYLRAVLRGPGYGLALARNGLEALEAARAVLPSAVITDIRMPAMDGIEFVRLMRTHEHLERVPVIFYTSCAGDEVEARVRSVGAFRLVLKPSTAVELLAAVSEAIASAA